MFWANMPSSHILGIGVGYKIKFEPVHEMFFITSRPGSRDLLTNRSVLRTYRAMC